MIRKLAVLMILITLIQSVLPNERYQQYFKFCAGMILIVVLITPALQLVQRVSAPDSLETLINSFFDELEAAAVSGEGLEGAGEYPDFDELEAEAEERQQEIVNAYWQRLQEMETEETE